MSLGTALAAPFYEGAPQADPLSLGVFPVALNGRPYQLDTADMGRFRHYSVKQLRAQADNAARPGEGSINPEDSWRRAVTSFHQGQGQSHLDRPESNPFQYHESRGVDPWTKYQLTLLPDTDKLLDSSSTNLHLAVAGDYLYVADDQTLKYTDDTGLDYLLDEDGNNLLDETGEPLEDEDPITWSSASGTHASTIVDMVSIGTHVLTAHGANGVYWDVAGAGSAALLNAVDADVLGYVNGRVMVASDEDIYNITNFGSTTAPAAHFTHPNTGFRWVGFADGPSVIYAAGNSGDKGQIWKIPLLADGTGLDVPQMAGRLPDGETVTGLAGYLNLVFIGTTKGVRMAQPGENGDLTIGGVLDIGASVRCFEGQERFVWFGWETMDSSTCGLGRLDLTQFTDSLEPAYATDLAVATTGEVRDVVTFGDKRVFTISQSGVWGQSPVLVPSGWVTTGSITYDLPDQKVALNLTPVYRGNGGSITFAIATEGGSFTTLDTRTVSDEPVDCREARGDEFELRFTLTRATDADTGPTFHAATLRSEVVSTTTEMIEAPLLLHRVVEGDGGALKDLSPREERDRIRRLRESTEVVSWQEGPDRQQVVVADYEWHPVHWHADIQDWDGTCYVLMKEVK